jgi:mediator of RNA polymerase II transcription subunit 7
MEEEVLEHQNPYPAPPSHFVNYTDHNLALLALLRERVPVSAPPLVSENASQSTEQLPPIDPAIQAQLLEDKTDVPSWALTDLEPPRVDWILEEGGTFGVFGEVWNVRCAYMYALHTTSIIDIIQVNDVNIQSLAEANQTQLFPEDRSVGRSPSCPTPSLSFHGELTISLSIRPSTSSANHTQVYARITLLPHEVVAVPPSSTRWCPRMEDAS